MKDEKFGELIENFYTYLMESKQEYLRLFSKLQIQIEGWFRGELMNFLRNNNIDITVENREIRINTRTHKKVDFKLEFTNEIYWIELKHLLVGYQLDSSFPLKFYFNDDTYIDNDIKKLQEVDHSDKKQYLYSLAFISTNYPYNKSKNSKNTKITSTEVLSNEYNSIIERKNYNKNGICLKSVNYDDALRFGYSLIKINCPKIL